MGYVLCMGACFACKKPFSFNPNKVPSIRVDGMKREVCESCIRLANPRRKANGLDEIVIRDGAYEPMPEEELVI